MFCTGWEGRPQNPCLGHEPDYGRQIYRLGGCGFVQLQHYVSLVCLEHKLLNGFVLSASVALAVRSSPDVPQAWHTQPLDCDIGCVAEDATHDRKRLVGIDSESQHSVFVRPR